MNSVIRTNDQRLINYVRKEHLKVFKFPVFELGLTDWYFKCGEDGMPVSGFSVAQVNEDSYPFVAEGKHPDEVWDEDVLKPRELTNLFSFNDQDWLQDIVDLMYAALCDFNTSGTSDVVVFTHKPLLRFFERKQGFDISYIEPTVKKLDADSALERMKERYGFEGMNYDFEEHYLKRHRPRGVTFNVKQALGKLEGSALSYEPTLMEA